MNTVYNNINCRYYNSTCFHIITNVMVAICSYVLSDKNERNKNVLYFVFNSGDACFSH